jgi:hypothetical protein
MKRIVLMALLTLALPLTAFAGSVDFVNVGGTLIGSSAGLSLTDSELIAIRGIGGGGWTTGALGSLGFSTGTLASGSLQMGGTFNGGGSFEITGNGTDGVPSGTIFNGSFAGPVTWTLITLKNSTHNYILTGSLMGTWYNGRSVQAATVQLTINTGKGYFNGRTTISSGNTSMVVPEPGTLGLLETGLVGLAGVLFRKLKV